MTLSKEKVTSAIESLMRHPNSFFGEARSQDVAAGLRELLERRERDGQEPNIGEISVGRLSTMNQDEYPGLGDWWVQLRIGEDSEEVLARVYGSTPQEANNRAYALACRAAMHAATISNSADFAIDEAEPVSQPYKLVGEVVAWNAPQQQGVYRSVDFRWIDMDVPPGTKLYAMDKE